MGHRPRAKPKYLHSKLLAIRQWLDLSQSQMAKQLGIKTSFSRICEYEKGNREPNLLVLLRYSEIAQVHMETLVSDRVNLEQFQDELEQ